MSQVIAFFHSVAQYCSYGWTDALNNRNHPRHSCTVNAYYNSKHICSCGAMR